MIERKLPAAVCLSRIFSCQNHFNLLFDCELWVAQLELDWNETQLNLTTDFFIPNLTWLIDRATVRDAAATVTELFTDLRLSHTGCQVVRPHYGTKKDFRYLIIYLAGWVTRQDREYDFGF